jgi:uncharacterized NAD-dependent epimerase/dehydratase family protein
MTATPTPTLYRRLALLTQGGHDIYRNKTAMGMLRFRPDDVVCVVDANHAGEDLQALTGAGSGIPIVATVQEAVALGIDWVVIGIATPGGLLPDELRLQVYDAIKQRVGVISGLHESVTGDPNVVSLAARYAVELVNLRKLPNEDFPIGTAQARHTSAFRVLVVGTDASIGKTTTALELTRHLEARGINARFVSTGQDGKLVTGRGICIDRVISNFASGAVEGLVTSEAKLGDILIIEGQDGLLSPPYSGVALSLLHGSCPDAMVLCHAPTRTVHRHTDVPIPPLPAYRRLYEDMLAPLHPGKVIAVALNTLGLDAKTAQAEIAAASKSTGLPCVDVVRVLPGNGGCEELANAVLAAWEAAGSARRVTAKAARKTSKKSRAKKTKANKTVSPATKKAVKPATKPAVRKNVKKVTKR